MDLKDLRSFVAVSESHGFRRAAEHLGIEQSALSRRISNLEDQLGVSLFERHRGGARMTAAGQRFLIDVRIVLSHLDAALRTVQSAGHASEGALKIGVILSFSSGSMNTVLREYRSAHPHVEIEIVEGNHREHLANVAGRMLDVAFLTGIPQPKGYDVENLWHEPIFVALSNEDPRAQADYIQLSDMVQDQFLVTYLAAGSDVRDFIIQRLAKLGFSPRIAHHHVGREGLMSLVGLGFGVSLISASGTGISYPQVAFVPVVGEVLPFSAVWCPENDNPALRRLLSAARTEARKVTSAAPLRTLDRSP